MNRESNGRKFPVSERIYGSLLSAYPPAHRAAYGAAMAQLFRDQCRDAWDESRNFGLLKLWLSVLPDLARTSIMERLAVLNERKTMSDKLANLAAFGPSPQRIFTRVFVMVFLLVVVASVAVTYILPEVYASSSTIRIQPDKPAAGVADYDPYFNQTQFEIITSRPILEPVIAKLHLDETWGKKYFHGQKLKDMECFEILKARLSIAPVRNTTLARITVYSEDRLEAAKIANAVADSYADYRQGSKLHARREALAVLEEHYAEQEKQINGFQSALADQKQKFEIPDHPENLAAALATAEKSLLQIRSQLTQLKSLDKKTLRETLPMIVTNAVFTSLVEKLHDGERQYATLLVDFPPNHPQVQRLTASMEVLNKQLDESAAAIMTSLESQAKSEMILVEEMNTQVARSKPSPETESYWNNKRLLEQLQAAHTLAYSKLQAEKLDLAIPEAVAVQITDLAEPGRAPVKPNKTLNITIGAFVGIFTAGIIGGAAALIAFNTRKRRQSANAPA